MEGLKIRTRAVVVILTVVVVAMTGVVLRSEGVDIIEYANDTCLGSEGLKHSDVPENSCVSFDEDSEVMSVLFQGFFACRFLGFSTYECEPNGLLYSGSAEPLSVCVQGEFHSASWTAKCD